MLMTIAYFICLPVSLYEVFRRWRVDRLRACFPLVTCVVAWYVAGYLEDFLQAQFFNSNLPRFQAIVSSIQLDSLPPGGELKAMAVSEADKRQIQHVFVRRGANDSIVVEIDTGNGFPVKHSGYVFSSSGAFPSDERFRYRWPYVEEIRQGWFRVSN